MTRPQAIETARRMWAGGEGWSIKDIRDYLAKRGHDVLWETVKCWVDPEWAAKRRAQNRDKQRRRNRERNDVRTFRVLDVHAREVLTRQIAVPPIASTPDLLLALRLEDGLAYPAIAAVLRRFFGEDLSPEQVRARLNELGAPKNEKKAANATAQARRRQMRVAA